MHPHTSMFWKLRKYSTTEKNMITVLANSVCRKESFDSQEYDNTILSESKDFAYKVGTFSFYSNKILLTTFHKFWQNFFKCMEQITKLGKLYLTFNQILPEFHLFLLNLLCCLNFQLLENNCLPSSLLCIHWLRIVRPLARF